MKVVGRQREKAELKRYFESGRPEFIAVTGRTVPVVFRQLSAFVAITKTSRPLSG